ncbi:MAG: VOC family protein [Christensenellaceae bacterium]|jgi:uncharacterized glyoxalase superfamily protein PhnB|nr:VOC family protein [Christensenellaceae bacterium]
MAIRFGDIALITGDVLRLRAFYERVFGEMAEGDEMHSALALEGMGFAFDSALIAKENPAFFYLSGQSASNIVIGFDVSDAGAEYDRLLALGVETLNAPTTHPWGARSFQFRDPDGNILNFRQLPGGARPSQAGIAEPGRQPGG